MIGLEIQRRLVVAARHLTGRLALSRVSTLEGDAVTLAGLLTVGSVFFLYCPFGGDRLAKVLADLEPMARTRTFRVCCVDLPLLARSWLRLEPQRSRDLAIYRTRLHDPAWPAAQMPRRVRLAGAPLRTCCSCSREPVARRRPGPPRPTARER